MPKFGTKNALFGYFWADIWKQHLSYLKLTPSNLSICKILEKKPKMTKLPYLGILGLDFSKIIDIFEISTFKLVYLQNFAKKQKSLNLGPKVPYLGIFVIEL